MSQAEELTEMYYEVIKQRNKNKAMQLILNLYVNLCDHLYDGKEKKGTIPMDQTANISY